MRDGLPLSRKGRMISSTGERSRDWSLVASLRIFFLEAFEALVANVLLGEELLVCSVGVNLRQSQHNVHLLSSTIVHVKHEAKTGNTHLQ